MSWEKTGEYSFPGFEMAHTRAPELTSAVVTACMRHASSKFSQVYFGEHMGEEEVEESGGNEAYQPARQAGIDGALRAPVNLVAWVNCFVDAAAQERTRGSQCLQDVAEEIPQVFQCSGSPPADPGAAAFRASATVLDEHEGLLPRIDLAQKLNPEMPAPLLPCCFLSGASVLAAQALQVAQGERVLDLCAGPGAKALLLASMLFDPRLAGGDSVGHAEVLKEVGTEAGVLTASDFAASQPTGLLVCNEPQRARATLLEGVLAAFLPKTLLGKGGRVVLTKAEASAKVPPALLRYAPFDKVLVDPPCTPARRSAKRRGNRAHPDPEEAKRNADLSEELLRCAGSLVRPGGLLVYTTSSLQEEENDAVVQRFLRRMGGDFRAEPGEDDAPISGAEKTVLGTMILPDQGTLHGPLYLAKLRRQCQ